MGTAAGIGGVFMIIAALFLFILFILWCLMPFLIMGTNGRLEQIIKQNKQMIELLERKGP